MHRNCFLRSQRPALHGKSAVRQFATGSCLRRAFRDGSSVILRDKRDASHDGKLIKLDAAKATATHRGVIKHVDIIGKEPREFVQASNGASFRLHEPTLAEYIRLTPRLVTPIYPGDANLIVSLLDVHVDTFPSTWISEPPLEILEAGTGHGALTLHLSRAIHAANPPYPSMPSHTSSQEEETENVAYLGESASDLQESAGQIWRASRRAIVHTLDIESKYSKHAQKIIQGFRGGMYAPNIDFHVGDISAWIANQRRLRKTEEPFLTHVLLDLPSANAHLAGVAPALHVNGMLAVFNPSITQIVECVETIREQRMPYLLDQIIELGAGTIREWDVRAVKPRATLREKSTSDLPKLASEQSTSQSRGRETKNEELAEDLTKQEEKWAMVCRPKVGSQVVGGFLGLWKRMKHTTSQGSEASKQELE